jgi:cation transport ATPase
MKTTLTIKGTHCNACKMLIEDVCKDHKEVSSCTVDFTTGKTEIEHNGLLDIEALKKEIEEVGKYQVEINNK